MLNLIPSRSLRNAKGTAPGKNLSRGMTTRVVRMKRSLEISVGQSIPGIRLLRRFAVNRPILTAGRDLGLLAAFLVFALAPPWARCQPQAPPSEPAAGASTARAAGSPATGSHRHPLDPLGPDEIAGAVAIVKKERSLPEATRFVTVALHEPSKHSINEPRPNESVAREAFLVLLNTATGRAYEAVVDLGASKLTRYDALPRRRAAVDHARRVRRVRGGRQAVARRSAPPSRSAASTTPAWS